MYRNAILKTIAYADVFDFPLTKEELKERLVGRRIKDNLFEKSLISLLGRGKLIKTGDFFHFPYRADLPEKRQKAKFHSSIKINKAKRISKILKYIPWIKLVGVTGAVAAQNSLEDDDIDILVVSGKRRVWLTRFLVVLVLKLTGSYRSKTYPNNKICPNIFVDEERLSWSETDRDIYTANEVILLKPVFEKNQTYLRFLYSNRWYLDFLPNHAIAPAPPDAGQAGPQKGGMIGDLIERMLMRFQLWYMRNKRTNEIVDRDFIHFKKKDNKDWILKKYNEKLKILGLPIRDRSRVKEGSAISIISKPISNVARESRIL